MLDKLKSTDFSAHLKQTFQIQLESGEALAVELVEVKELGQNRAGLDGASSSRAFSIVFQAAQEALLPQKIYRVEHEKMGMLDLFLVPVGPKQYEALFT